MSIPKNTLVPGPYGSYDSSRALQSQGTTDKRTIIFAEKLSTGTGTVDQIYQPLSESDAEAIGGIGSRAAEMYKVARAVLGSSPLYLGLVADPSAGASAAGQIVISGTATENGIIDLLVNGKRVQSSVAKGATASVASASLRSALGDDPTIGMVITGADPTIILTDKHKGATGNKISIVKDYFRGSFIPAGLTVTITQPTGGSGYPDPTNIIDAMGDTWYRFGIHAWGADSAVTAEFNLEAERRQGATVSKDFEVFTATKETHGNTTTILSSENSQWTSFLPVADINPTSPWIVATAFGAGSALYGGANPHLPLLGVRLYGVWPELNPDLWDWELRQLMLTEGGSTSFTDAGGVVRIERVVTTYKTNVLGLKDKSWRDINVPLLLSDIRDSWRIRISNKYFTAPGYALAEDASGADPTARVIDPKTLGYEAIAFAEDMQTRGWISDVDGFAKALISLIDPDEPTRVNMEWAPKLTSPFSVLDLLIYFRLN